MLTLVIIISVLTALALTRVGVSAEYTSGGEIRVAAKFGLLKIKVLPAREKKRPKKERKKKEKKPKEEKEEEPQEEKKRAINVKALFLAGIEALGRLRRKLTINELTIHYMAAGDDPAKAAINFGRASIGLGAIAPIFENNFKIKKRDFRTAVDFDATEMYVYIKAKLTLAIWEIIYIAWAVIPVIFKTYKSNRKAEVNNG